MNVNERLQSTIRVLIASILVGLAPCCLLAQEVLRITSPRDREIVSPGQTITVLVSVTTGVVLKGAALALESPLTDPLPILDGRALAMPNLQFSVTIPSHLSLRQYRIVAQGATDSGRVPSSGVVHIDVERPDFPKGIEIDYSQLDLAVGEQIPLELTGKFLDGSTYNLSRSTRTRYEAAPQGVVSVSKEGNVRALSLGQAVVTTHYKIGTLEQHVATRVIVARRQR
jgi:hypothetical protein